MSQDLLVFAFQSVPFLTAALLGFMVPVAAIVSGWLADKWSDSSKVAAIFGVLVLGSAVAVLLSGRTVYSAEEAALHPSLLSLDLEQGRAAWAGRISNGIILFISLGEIARWLIGRHKMPAPAKSLWLAFLGFYLASYWVGVAFATSREIRPSWLYAPVAFTAIALIARTGVNRDAFRKLQWVLVFVLAASLAMVLVAPGMVLEKGYKSLIPGVNFRFYGLSDHANSLGMLAAMSLILQLSPFVRARSNLVFLAISLVALVLAQSKTAWVVALVGIPLVRYEYFRGRFQDKDRGHFPMLVIAGGSLVVVFALLGFGIAANTGALDRVWNMQDAITFTGRTRIWEISWNEFLANPLFGYGPALWDLTYRWQNNFMAAGQAHSQFFQTAGQAGGLGLLAWFTYLYLMGRNCLAAWQVTSGLAGTAFVSLVLRCFSESPMQLGGLGGMEAFTHLLAFAFAASVASAPVRSRYARPVVAPTAMGKGA
jgi:O-antigen ligase